MSYEGGMLEELKMPSRKDVEEALLISLFKHQGVIKEFGSGEEIVDEIASYFTLSELQRNAFLETVYRKENRVKKVSLWHRLLFRAAASLANEDMVSRPTETIHLTNRREWMLTEKGFDTALMLMNIPEAKKDTLGIKSFEVQQVVKKITQNQRPEHYNPFSEEKKTIKIERELRLRARGFRQAVIEAYDYTCAVCGMKMYSPDFLSWEVEAAHIVPHSFMGKDDIWNGIALCRLHHWAFDTGWFTLTNDLKTEVSPKIRLLPQGFGVLSNFDFIKALSEKNTPIILPERKEIYPHINAINWHRENVFFQK
ncbi:MAG: HNH endonuclease [Cytophagaceae bacterium]|nr:HNH endonuclease [Cytophagaceae bacterium]